ncbi:MAG: hypothetical protein H0X38_14850 [Planctomycetes bacterium]|nr:hypothetical protein [Planctomycetota bacterium]
MLLRGLPPGAAYAAEIEVIGRGGVVMASGRASGHASAALSAAAALDLAVVPAQATGAPPSSVAGTVWAVPDLVQVDPLSGAADADPGVAEAAPAGTWSQGNPAWSGSARTVHVAVPRGAWAAFQLVCAGRQPTTTWTITPGDLDGPGGARIPATAIRLARLWYQQVGGKWRPDPLVPLAAGAPFQIPDARNAVPGQANQTVYVEWFVPAEASPGIYHGTFSIATDAGALPITVELAVAPAVIPSAAAFTWSMNAYSSPGADFGAPGSAEFLAAERAFYRLAHEHRTTLAILGYSHGADFQTDVAPPLTGSGAAMRVADWSAWDRRYGPLLDGSAFAGTARAAVPLDHFYLPFMESWPTPMAAGYRWNALTWEDHWRLAGTVGEGFSKEYQAQWVAVMRDFIAHIRAKGWRTSFQVYLNDKYYYKQYDAHRKAAGHGTSFWLLDEPQHIDDFLALEFFGGLTRAAQAGDRTTIVQRVDLSRPEWGRDTLDQVIDLDVSGGFNGSRPLLEDWRARHDQRVWTYGSAPSSAEGALGIAAQALDLYSRGVDGFVPWMTLGSAQNWTEFAETCVLYCGKPVGVDGPCASLRLKAYRRGEEDAALLKAVAAREGLLTDDPDRRRIGALIAPALGGGRALGSLDGQGAVTERLTGLTIERLDALRRALCTRAAP